MVRASMYVSHGIHRVIPSVLASRIVFCSVLPFVHERLSSLLLLALLSLFRRCPSLCYFVMLWEVVLNALRRLAAFLCVCEA